MSDFKTTTVTGTINWAYLSVDKPGKSFEDKPQYECTMTVPKSMAEKWANAGLTQGVKQNKDGDYILKLSVPVTARSGKVMDAPKVTHVEGYQVDPATVGNGSKGTATVNLFPYSNKFGTGYTKYLKSVEIETLEIYNPEDEVLEEFEF